MLDILRTVVSAGKWGTAGNLFNLIKEIGKRCEEAQPIELCIGNTVRRVLSALREECHSFEDDKCSVLSLFLDRDGVVDDYSMKQSTCKSAFVLAINNMIKEMKQIHGVIAMRGYEHIHSNEIILTCGSSKTIESFFLKVAEKRTFQVIVAESAPSFAGQRLAVALAKKNITTTLIPDSAVSAVMARVNKCVLGTHAVLANGGLIALAGSSNIAVSAKHFSIPVVVLTGIYKLTPRHPYSSDVFNVIQSPAGVADYADDSLQDADFVNPMFDYVSPDLLSLYVTDDGAYAPSYMYRLLAESYHPDDENLQ